MSYAPDGGAAAKIALALAIGLLVGFEREWSNKEAGIRTCALTALLGTLAALISPAFAIAGLGGVLLLVVFVNVRALRVAQAVEITTSAALLLVYALGVMVGVGDFFAAVAAAIAATLLLTWKVELHRFAGGLHPNEIRSAVWLGLLALVIYPLLPNRDVDPWGLVNPHTVWVAVIVVAAVGFVNYILVRLYSARGMVYSAVLGGAVSSTPALLELGAALKALGQDWFPMGVTITLLATLAMFGRNLLLVAIFSPAAARTAWLPLTGMAGLAAGLVWWRRGRTAPAGQSLTLPSPISMRRVLEFGLVFLLIQVAASLCERHWGHSGAYAVAVLGGLFNSASSTAAVGEMAAHGKLAPAAAGVATVLTSMASAAVNPPVINRLLRDKRLGWTNEGLVWAILALGAVLLALR